MFIFILILIILLITSAVVVYKTAEVHKLHKMRAAFEDKRVHILSFLNKHHNEESRYEYYKGELDEIEEMESLIDKELEDLKNFDF